MSTVDDALFRLAVLILCVSAIYELWWTGSDMGSRLWVGVRSLYRLAAERRRRFAASPLLASIPVGESPSQRIIRLRTNYLETMSPEEMDLFLNER